MSSPDVIIAAVTDLLPGWDETVMQSHPVFQQVIKSAGGIETLGTTHKEWLLTDIDPGQFNTIVSGHETINAGRNQAARRANAYPFLSIYGVEISYQEIRNTRSEHDVGQLVESVPERSVLGMINHMASQMVMGTNPALGGLFTFNGEQNYSPMGYANQGLLEFADADAQTGTIFGHARNSFEGWHNQYVKMTSMSFDGERAIRRLNRLCSQQGFSSALGGPKVWLADSLSFENYITQLGDKVVINDKQGYDPQAGQSFREGIPMGFNGAMMYNETAFDLSGFSGDAQNGVIYAVDADQIRLFKQETGDAEVDGSAAKGDSTGLLKMRATKRLPYSDAMRLEFLLSLGMYSKQLRTHGALTGSAKM